VQSQRPRSGRLTRARPLPVLPPPPRRLSAAPPGGVLLERLPPAAPSRPPTSPQSACTYFRLVLNHQSMRPLPAGKCSNREALRGLAGSPETIRIYQTTPCTDMDSRIHVLSLSFDDCARRALNAHTFPLASFLTHNSTSYIACKPSYHTATALLQR